MNSKRVYFGMLSLLVVLIVLSGAAVFLGNKMLQNKSAKLMDLKLTHRVLEQQQVSLVQANKDVEKYAELDKTAKSIVPQDKDQAKTVRELVKIAEESGVTLASISFPSSNLGTVVPKPASPTPATGETATTPAVPVIPSVSQVKPVDGIVGLYQLEINLQSEATRPITYDNLQSFLSRLEQNRRTAQVSQISISPRPTDPRFLSFTIAINVFIKP